MAEECEQVDKASNPDDKVEMFDSESYSSEKVFCQDKQILASQWIFVDHLKNFEKEGDYRVCHVMGEYIVLVKQSGSISAYLNVCRHRKSVICTEKKGNTDKFVCPYHGWSYGLDGVLTSKGSINVVDLDAQDRKALSLKKVNLKIFEGLIFVCLKDRPESNFNYIQYHLSDLFSWNGVSSSKVASKKNYLFKANWKLVVENFLECYHCYPNHPQLCETYAHPMYTATESPEKNKQFFQIFQEWETRIKQLGHPLGSYSVIDPEQEQYVVGFRLPISPYARSLGENGEKLSSLMGDIAEYDSGETFGYIGPLLHFSLLNDHCMLIRIDPVSPLKTEVQVTWLVDANAFEGKDYYKDKLTRLWDTTIKQDRLAVERCQLGALSSFGEIGSYTKLEEETARFKLWYSKRHDNYVKNSNR